MIAQTRFAAVADGARLLHEEMQSLRSKAAGTWWRSHFTEKCRCPGCSGQETDILAIFETIIGTRFALHFEVKQPSDHFPKSRDQATNYALRAACWIANPPKSVPIHDDADTVLLCSGEKLNDYGSHPAKFGTVITFEDVAEAFPQATGPV